MVKKIVRATRARLAAPLSILRRATGGNRVFVNASATQGGNGRSWQRAYLDLSVALQKSPPGSEIWIAGGVYKPDRGTGDRESRFVVKQGFRMLGGFAGGESREDQRDPRKNLTVLSGRIDPDGDPDKSSFHVVSVGWVVRDGLLDGLIVEGGNAERFGGGLMIHGSGRGGITVRDCVIRENQAYAAGGVFCLKSDPVFERCRFERNTAIVRAGALYTLTASPHVIDCEFVRNWSAEGGSGIYNIQGDPVIERCRFIENQAEEEGAAMLSISGRPEVRRCLFERNSARFGAAYCHDSGFGTIEDCRFVRNEAGEDGGALLVRNGFPIVERCTFENNHARRGGAIFNVRGRFDPVGCRFSSCTADEGHVMYAGTLARSRLLACSLEGASAGLAGEGSLEIVPPNH